MKYPLEEGLQMALAGFLRDYLAEGWQFTHPASGEFRHIRTATKLKAMGVNPGWPDLILVSPEGRFHGMELKRQKRKAGANVSDLTDEQKEFRNHCIAYGWPYVIVDRMDEAMTVFEIWGCLRVNVKAG